MAHRTAARPAPAGRPPADFPAEVLPHLGMPALIALTADDAAGRTCIWGGRALPLAAAVDLGEHLLDGVLAFPQSCGPCIVRRATDALAVHSPDCPTCRDRERWTECTVGYGLLSAQRQGLRVGRGGCR
ncbi:hypothetical protein ACGFZR_24895 [Streptomyces sp. NPDC048241]|uniref:hypothetical protein n=1 Tax=Streptomyces sp. NPDC048241 TaxID=3365521 RepID=UPI003714B8F3